MGWYDSFKTGTLDYIANGWGRKRDKNKKKKASTFWASEFDSYYSEPKWWDGDKYQTKEFTKVEAKTSDLLKLNAHRRAISNFVNILTNKNIPVRFAIKGDSYTDGRTVTLSAEVKPEKFDVAVGLALHEASHIVLTDFNFLPKYVVPNQLNDKFQKINPNATNDDVFGAIKNLLNFVEDRRIDNYIFKTCPGYRDYYRALYDEFFYDNSIDKGLKSDEYTDETLDSYMFRIINITNQNSDLSKLKGLKHIYQILDLKNIDRLKSTTDSYDVAYQIINIILDNIISYNEQQNGNGEGDGNEGKESDNQQSNQKQSGEQNDDMGGADGDAPVMGDQSNEQKDLLSKSAKEKLDRQIKKQKEFIDNEFNKKKITKNDEKNLQSIEDSGTDMESVGNTKLENGGYIQSVQCIVSKRMNEKLMENNEFPFANKWGEKWSGWNEKVLQKGIAMGTVLGKRIAVRSEERETINPRQKNGRIDKRLVAALGYDYESVFSTKEIDKYKKVLLHVSIDGSGSMSGTPWNNTLAVTIALCKAASMVSNLEIQVSIRGTWGDKPYICIAYDSRVDKFEKVKRLFPALHANGTTPEGLCYQAIMKHFVESNKDMDSYFLNICDGEPTFSNAQCNYGGENAILHTKKMVKQIKDMGIKVMAYYVSEGSYHNHSHDRFRRMYGSDSRFINVEEIVPIVKTMNELFLKK